MEKYLTVKEIAMNLGVSIRCIFRWVETGAFPKPLRIGGTVRWQETAIQNWLNRKEQKFGKADISLYDLYLTKRLETILSRLGFIDTKTDHIDVAKILNFTEREIRCTRNAGQKTVREFIKLQNTLKS